MGKNQLRCSLSCRDKVESSETSDDGMSDILKSTLDVTRCLGALVGLSEIYGGLVVCKQGQSKGSVGVAGKYFHNHLVNVSACHNCYALSVAFSFTGRHGNGIRNEAVHVDDATLKES